VKCRTENKLILNRYLRIRLQAISGPEHTQATEYHYNIGKYDTVWYNRLISLTKGCLDLTVSQNMSRIYHVAKF